MVGQKGIYDSLYYKIEKLHMKMSVVVANIAMIKAYISCLSFPHPQTPTLVVKTFTSINNLLYN
jgi:hypothetical protein